MVRIFQPWLNLLKMNMRLSNLITQPHNANTLKKLRSVIYRLLHMSIQFRNYLNRRRMQKIGIF